MKDNTIKDNSVGIQAGHDLTVSQTVNELPESMQNMFLELLKPSVEQIGKNLQSEISSDVSKSIGMKIRTVLEDGFVKSLKDQIKSQNLNYHLEVVLKKIHEDGNEDQGSNEKIHKVLKKTDLFLEWVESAEDISPEDNVLSKIWQNWLYKLSQSRDNANNKILLDKMKQLTPDDADVLLRNRRRSLSRLGGNLRADGKLNYLTKKLSDMGLLVRNYYYEIATFLFSLIVIWFFLNRVFDSIHTSVFKNIDESFLYLGSFIIPLLFYMYKPFYSLTWIGKEIVSFANSKIYSLNGESFENLKKEGVPKEIIKKIKLLIYTKFYTENEFIEALSKQINSDQLKKYKVIILKHSYIPKN